MTKTIIYTAGLALAMLAAAAWLVGQGPSVPVAMRFGAGLPAGPCTVGQTYYRTDAPAGANLADCTPTGWAFRTVYGATTLLWNSAPSPVTALSPGATPCNIVIFGPAGTVRARSCNPGEDMDGAVHLPHGYAQGTDLAPDVQWSAIDAGAGNVRWGIDYYWLNEGQAAVGAPTTILTTDQATGGVAWRRTTAEFPGVSGTGKLIASTFIFRIYRTTAAAGEYGSRAALLEVDLHFQADALGSLAEHSK